LSDRAVIWSRTDRPARMLVEYDVSDRFANARTVRGPHALSVIDFTTRVDLLDLPPGQDIFIASGTKTSATPESRATPPSGIFERRPLPGAT
jgi:alkaline phosphatase D